MSLNQIPPKPDVGAQPFQVAEDVFTSSGTWTKPAGVDFVEVVVVAGGGAGGGAGGPIPGPNAGGGGGGGAVIKRHVPVTGPVPVTVGAGGTTIGVPPFGPGPSSFSSNGGNSIFGSGLTAVIAFGGGAGGNAGPTSPLAAMAGRNGGTGGGAGAAPFSGSNAHMSGSGGGAGAPAITHGFWAGSPLTPSPSPISGGGIGSQGGGGGISGAINPANSRNQPDPNNFNNFLASATYGGRGIDGFGGGGAGDSHSSQTRSGAVDGGGYKDYGPAPETPSPIVPAVANTGGGGFSQQAGASGIVIVRYTV